MAKKKSVNEPDCKECGSTTWLLMKTEQRSYYSPASDENMRWIELTKKKKIVGGLKIICGKCEAEAEQVTDQTYDVKQKPLRVIWHSSFWIDEMTPEQREAYKKTEEKRKAAISKFLRETGQEEEEE